MTDPPANLTKPCADLPALPYSENAGIPQKEAERQGTADAGLYAECKKRHADVVAFYQNRDRKLGRRKSDPVKARKLRGAKRNQVRQVRSVSKPKNPLTQPQTKKLPPLPDPFKQ